MRTFDEQLAAVGRDNPGLDKKWGITGAASLSEQALSQANDTELNAVYQVVSNLPHWQQIPGQLRSGVRFLSRPSVKRNGLRSHAILMGDSCTESGTTYPDPGLAQVLAYQDAASAGHIALDILPDSDVYGLIVAGEGAVVTSPVSIERSLVQAVTVGLDVGALITQNEEALFQQCASDAQAVELDTIKSDIETTVENGLTTITTNVAALQSDLDASVTNIRSDISGLKSDLDSSVATIESTLATINGKLDAVANQVTGVQTTVDTNVEQRQLKLSVVSLTNGNRMLVSTTEGGVPVTGSLVSLKLATDNASAPAFTDYTSKVTTSNPVNGVLEITFPSNQPANTIYLIQVQTRETITTGGQAVSKTYSGTILKELGQ